MGCAQPSALSTSCLAAEAVPKTSTSSTVRHSCSTAVPTPPAAKPAPDPLAGPHARDAEQHVVGGEVADRHRGGFLEAHRRLSPRLGIAVPGDAAAAHVQLKMPGGFSLELDTAESARLWHACWRADPASTGVVLGFSAAQPPGR